MTLALFTTRPQTPRGWFALTWRQRQEEPLFRERFRNLALALKRAGKLMRGGLIELYEGGFLSLEFDGWLGYCDSWSAREWQ